jgi:hypothetical protein
MDCSQAIFDAYALGIGTALLRFNAMEAELAELLRA